MKHGVEQELQVVNEDGHLVYEVSKILENIPEKYKSYGKGGIYQDKYQSQLEIATDACETLDELENQLKELRETAIESARKQNLFLIATGANPFTKGRVGEYFAEQHHLEAPSNKKKLRMNNFFRIFVPEIFALSADSPIHANHITKWDSVRASMDTYDPSKRVNPNIKRAPFLSEEDIERGYLPSFSQEKNFEQSRKKSRYFDVSPFTQKEKNSENFKPTLEIRLLDTQPYIPLTIAYGALFQALAKKLEKISHIPNINIEHNRNEAIKNSISSDFLIKRKMKRFFHYKDLSDSSAVTVVKSLLDWLNPELKKLGYEEKIKPLRRFLKYEKNLADWQVHLFSKRKDQYHSEILGATMENFNKPPMPEDKIKFNFVNKAEEREKLEWNEDIKEAYDLLEEKIQRSYQINFKEFTNSLLALRECNPNMREDKSRDLTNRLCKKFSKNSFYHSLLLLETLFRYEETENPIYKKKSKEMTNRIDSNLLKNKQLWISAYALSVMSLLGGEEFNKKEYSKILLNRIGENTPNWVKAYIVEYLTTSGTDGSKQLSNLKISLKKNHWECNQTDNVTATSIIYNCLSNIGYKNEEVVNWLKGKLDEQTSEGIKDIQKFSLNLRALSEEAIK